MPVRDKAIDVAFRSLMDDTPFHFYKQPGHETATIGDVTMPYAEFRERIMDPIEFAYERVVDSMDWNRVMLEAMARHLALDHATTQADKPGFPWGPDICPECICEALLADTTHVSWNAEPVSPRYHREAG